MDQATDKEFLMSYIGPANPIIDKSAIVSQKVNLSLSLPENQQSIGVVQEEVSSDDEISNEDDRITLFNLYSTSQLVYKKYNNSKFCTRLLKKYYASVFSNLAQKPKKQQDIKHSFQELSFNSNEESMNLFAVFQVGENQYDLILENDLNTSGYTQWFYFVVKNKYKNRNYRFNIINLYKSQSLYNFGMKPLIWSKKLNKGWKRGGTNIHYEKNQINIEYSQKFYSTLTFEYTFPLEEDETAFAHCYPYTYSHDLKERIKCLEQCKKVKIRTLAFTNLKKPFQMVHFNQIDNNPNKKAIVLMARQHPGESVGSFIMDEILSELTRHNSQNQFILWRYDIYCIPMVNIDGVILGNYRGNAFGYDLNRSWDRDNSQKIPQIYAIKNQIRKIQKKQQIQLIVDLHGHSKKMGSFFFGNPFGKHTGLFPYIASKYNTNISFENSTFNKEKKEKTTAARVILGNLIKQTGSFYTYETSFYGGWKSNKKVHFDREDYKLLGKSLISSIYKTYFQIYREEKTLKESMFLRQTRKVLKVVFKSGQKGGSQSDSEAETITKKQIKKNDEIELNFQSNNSNENRTLNTGYLSNRNTEKIRDLNQLKLKPKRNQFKNEFLKKQKKIMSLGMSPPKFQLYKSQKEDEVISAIKNKRQIYTVQNKRKSYLMAKLRIFGETFIEEKQKQTINEAQKQSKKLDIIPISEVRKVENRSFTIGSRGSSVREQRSFRTKSFMVRVQNQQKLKVNQMFKVNKYENGQVPNQVGIEQGLMNERERSNEFFGVQ